MIFKKVKVNDLIPNEKNVRTHGEKQIQEFKKSIEMFGVIRPVVIDENNVLIAGHGLHKALKELGIEEVDAYILKGLTEEKKLKLMLSDNKIYELGTTNFDFFSDILKDISLGGDLNIPGYDEDILNSLIVTDINADKDISKYGEVDDERIEEIKSQGNSFNEKMGKENLTVQSSLDGEKEIVLDPEKIKVEINESFPDGNPRPYVICEHCGEKTWL